MRRVLFTIGALAALGVTSPAVAGAAVAPAQARVVACHPAVAQAERFVVFEGAMQHWRRSAHMEIRFDLFTRTPGATGFQPVPGPGLGSWNRARDGVARYRYRKRVENLPAPAGYRAVVSFRWLGARGKVRGRASRLTTVCQQPDQRPDLRIGSVTMSRGPGRSTRRYTVVVSNDGHSAAGDFDLVLSIDGLERPAETVAGLAAGERRAVSVIAPKCAPGGSVAIVLDPDNRVAEAGEANNSRSVPCPAG